MRRRLVIGLLAFAGTARAQSPSAAPTSIAVGDWQLAPAMEVRTRGEFRSDPPQLAAPTTGGLVQDTYGVLERTRIGLGAEYGTTKGDPGFLRAQVTLQDARAWGVPSPTGMLGGVQSAPSSTGLYEGYLEVRTSAARPAFLRIGRQAVTWGDGRLLSNADWSPVARTLDAIRGHASAGMFDFELLAAILETPTPLGVAFGQTTPSQQAGQQLLGAQLAAFPAPLLKLELSLLGRIRAGASGEAYVGSLRVFGDGSGWRYAVEGAFELQRADDADAQVLPAWAAAGYVEKTFDAVALSPSLRLGVDAASGTNGSGHVQFDPILPDVHSIYGAMDLFAWSNTLQASARATIAPWTDGRIGVEYRYVRLLEAGTWLDSYSNQISGAAASAELGHEIDAWASWRPWPVLEIVGGYSALLVSNEAQTLLSASPQSLDGSGTPPAEYTASVAHFAYLQATVRVP